MAKESKRIISLFPYSKDLKIQGDDNIAFTVTDAQWAKKMGRVILNVGENTFYGTGNIIDTKNDGKMIAMTIEGEDAPFASAVLSKFTNEDDDSTYLGGRSYDAAETAAITAAGIAGDRDAQNELRNTTGTRLSANVGKFDETIAPLGDIVRKPKKDAEAEAAPAAAAGKPSLG